MSEHNLRHCSKCGAAVDPVDTFCMNCGARLERTETVRSADPPPPPASKKPQGKFTRLLVTLLIVGLAYGGGKLLGNMMARDFITSSAPKTGTVNQSRALTQPPLITPIPTRVPSAPTVAPMAPSQQSGDSRAVWNYLEASDDEIRNAMTYFWYGTDPATGAQCAFFSDSNANRGGYYWWIRTSGRFTADFTMGTFVNPQPDSDVIQDRKEKTPVTLRSHDDGSLDFNFGNGEYINGTLRLRPDTTHKQEVLDMILNYKRTLSNMI